MIIWNAYIHHDPDPQRKQRLPPLSGTTIKDIIEATLEHHKPRETIILLAVHEVTYQNTKVPSPPRRGTTNSPPRGHVSTFQVKLQPAVTDDQFDPELFHEQARKFILQKWNHHHQSDFTTDPTTGLRDILPPGTHESQPTTNERAPQLRLYAPACNHTDCRGLGILAGLPPKTLYHKRAFLDVLATVRKQLLPFLPADLHLTEDFTTHIGLRDGTITGNQSPKGPHLTLPTLIISASSTEKFETLLDATEAFTAANKQDLSYHNVPFQLLPFPENPAERTEYVNSLKTIDQNFSTYTVVRLHNLNPHATQDDWDALYHLKDYRGIFPQFSAHNPSPESHHLFLHCNLGTIHVNPTNIQQKLAAFPSNLLTTTSATIAAKPPTPSPHRSTTIQRTKRLAELANRFNPIHNYVDLTTPSPSPSPDTEPFHDNEHEHDNNFHDNEHEHDNNDNDDHPQTRKRPASPHDAPVPSAVNKPPTPLQSNSFAALAEEDDEDNHPTNTTDPRSTPPPDTNLLTHHHNNNTANNTPTDNDRTDKHNRPPDHLLHLIPTNHFSFSQDTTHELDLLDDYIRTNNPTLLPTFANQLTNQLTSFNTTDAKTIWQFAHDLINDPTTTFINGPTNTHNNNTATDMDIDQNPTNSSPHGEPVHNV